MPRRRETGDGGIRVLPRVKSATTPLGGGNGQKHLTVLEVGSALPLNDGDLSESFLTTPFSKRYPRNIVPSDRHQQLVQAAWYEDNIDLVNQLVEFQTSVFSAGWMMRMVKAGKTAVKQVEQIALTKFLAETGVTGLVKPAIRDHCTFEAAVLYGKIGDDGELLFVSTNKPSKTIWNNAFGQNQLFIEISHLKDLRNKARTDAVAKDMLARLPSEFRTALNANKKWVELKESDGYFWVVKTNSDPGEGIGQPNMTTIFSDIELRQVFKKAEYNFGKYLKKAILHAKIGETVQVNNGILDERLLCDKAKVAEVKKWFQTTGDSLLLVTDHTIDVKFVLPPQDVFNAEWMKRPERAMMRWGHLNFALVDGEGGNFAASMISRESLRAAGRDVHRNIGSGLVEFVEKMQTMGIKATVPDGVLSLESDFDEQALKDPRILLQEQQAFFDRGFLDIGTILHESGRRRDIVKEGKDVDWQEQENEDAPWTPTFTRGGGAAGGGQTGRPGETSVPKPQGGQTDKRQGEVE